MKPLNINRESCSPVSSNCVIWQGPDIECIGLCKGATITEVTYQLAMELCNFLDSIKIENFDITCLDSTSCPPETFAELIKLIISYICNIQAQNGADGTNGNYTTVEAFAPGLNGCVNGGIVIRTFDGPTETQISEYFICNPEDGAEGPQGPQGTKGDYVIVAAAGSCPAGGYDIILYSGADDTVISTSTVCNGVAGAQGQGIDHTSFTTSTGTPSSTPNKSGETDTYTVWGDFAETINLGTFTVYNGDCECQELVWESLEPYLLNSFIAPTPPSKQPEFAFDFKKKLLYLRGIVLTLSSPVSGTNIAQIPNLVFDNETMRPAYFPAYRTPNKTFVELQIGDLGGLFFSINYADSVLGETVFINLDSLPVLRFD
jgi:hypothetical protein